MLLNDLKAEFGQAYVRAIAHAAGYFVQEAGRNMDADGIDLTMFNRSAEGPVRSPRLDIQLKTTTKPITADPFDFDLPIKNYNDLRAAPVQVPRILVVVVVPKDAATWVNATEESLLLRHCGYWISLRGQRPARMKPR